MRPTTRSEKILLAVLGLVLLGGLLFFGGSALTQKQRTLDLTRASLRADNAEAAVELQRQAYWADRSQWIRDHEPMAMEEGDASAQVLAFVVKGARDHHLEVQEQNTGQVEHGAGGTKVESEVRVKGGMEALCRWLAELQQQPENFYAVDLLSLKADQDEKSMVCTLHISRYFREGGQ
jgi:hypothetical protein